MNASNTLKKLGIEQTFNYIYKDPDKHMPKMMDWADKFADGEFVSQRKNNSGSNYRSGTSLL